MAVRNSMRSIHQQRRVAQLLVLALALGALLLGSAGCAPRRSIESVRVDARVDTLGTLDATEERTIVAPQGEPVEWEYTFRVGAVFEVLGISGADGDYALATDEAAEEPGTYTVTGDEDQIKVVAFPKASDASQTLTFHYRVQGAGFRWNDTSEFSWRFVPDAEKVPVDAVRIHVVLPGENQKTDVQAWANGPLYSETGVNDDGTVDVSASDLPPKTGLEVRVLFPRDALPDRMVSPWKRTADVLEYENDIALQVSVSRFMDRARLVLGWLLGVLAPGLGLGYTFSYWRKHRDEFSPAFHEEYYREQPADITPAIVSVLLADEVAEANMLAATAADLIGRGALALDSGSGSVGSFKLSRAVGDPEGLTRSERYLVTTLFDDVARASEFTLDDLRARLSTEEGAALWDRMLAEFRQRVGDELVLRRYLDHIVTNAATSFTWLAAVLFGVGLISWRMTASPIPVGLALIAAPAVVVIARKMRFVTQQADDLAGKYRGLRNYLRDLPALDEELPASLEHWHELLPLAVLFGTAEDVVCTLGERVPEVAATLQSERWLWAQGLARAITAARR